MLQIAFECGLQPGDFVHCLGDAHVYKNHIDALRIQLERVPKEFPKLTIKPREDHNGIEDFELSDFILTNYEPHGPIKMDMAV